MKEQYYLFSSDAIMRSRLGRVDEASELDSVGCDSVLGDSTPVSKISENVAMCRLLPKFKYLVLQYLSHH